MNKIFIIGNLTRDPEMRTLQNGTNVCSFSVAVNRRRQNSAEAGQPEADFFRVTAWRQLAENCNRFLAKGRKVAVTGSLSLQSYTSNTGEQRYSLEINADEVEFLTPRGEQGENQAPSAQGQSYSGYVQVENDDLPF